MPVVCVYLNDVQYQRLLIVHGERERAVGQRLAVSNTAKVFILRVISQETKEEFPEKEVIEED